MRAIRISTSCAPPARSSSSCWRAIPSTRWTIPTCLPPCRRGAPAALSRASRLPPPDAEAYWRDVGTIDAYWAANLDLVSPTPSLDIYDPNWPIWTYQQQLPPAKFIFDDDDRRGMAVDSMVSGGCIISGAQVKSSLLFSSVRVNSYAQTCEAALLPEGQSGRYARLNKGGVDRGCHIPENLGVGRAPALDAKRFYRSDGGVALISADMLDAL